MKLPLGGQYAAMQVLRIGSEKGETKQFAINIKAIIEAAQYTDTLK